MDNFAIIFGRPVEAGRIDIQGGTLDNLRFADGGEIVGTDQFAHAGEGSHLLVSVRSTGSCVIKLTADGRAFSVRTRDIIGSHWPVVIDDMSVAVSAEHDQRSYVQLRNDLARQAHALTALQQIEVADEESFEDAALHTRNMKGPIWLGVSRDIRLFGMSLRGIGAAEPRDLLWDWVQPLSHSKAVVLEESRGQPVRYHFLVGRGIGPSSDITRRLLDGASPILQTRITDGDIAYDVTAFAGLEQQDLAAAVIKGTNYLLADGDARGQMFTEKQAAAHTRLASETDTSGEQTVFFSRVTAINVGAVPRFAFIKAPVPDIGVNNATILPYSFDPSSGFMSYSEDRVFCVARLNGEPLSRKEMSILLAPGESATIEFRIPHSPISKQRAQQLASRRFEDTLSACLDFWNEKLATAAQFQLPERRIHEMVRAGINHLDLILFGEEPSGTLSPTVGVYSAIGSESAPIIQFLDSVGLHKTAERCLEFFFDKQHENGFMQNFFGYMLETEAVLWSLGEHFRYTRDKMWLARILPKLKLAYNYVIGQRHERLKVAAGNGGYGLLVGKTADPEDPFESFMLNGYACLGLSRAAEMLEALGDDDAARVAREAAGLKKDIRSALQKSIEDSPVVPLGDRTWSRTAPPWTGAPGPLSLDPESDPFYTHGSAGSRDTLLGPMWLVMQEVLQPEEPTVDWLLNYHTDIFYDRSVAFSQPYYSPHPWIHLMRGEPKQFLKGYYNMVSGLADRETFSFWEHYYHVSPHKTHEEAWFLMQTRWMLYLERDDELQLFGGIPRRWLHAGAVLDVERAASYFGAFNASVRVAETGDTMRVSFSGDKQRAPSRISVRLPHPDGRHAAHVDGGEYDATTETLHVVLVDGKCEAKVSF